MASKKYGHGKSSKGPRKPGASKKGYTKRDETRDDDRGQRFDDSTRNHHSNDPAWYAMSPQMLTDAAALQYSNVLGTTRFPNMGQQFSGNDTKRAFPGIMVLRTIPVPGISHDNSSPVNIAARNIYSFVRHANSGHANYDSPDLMMYIMAMDSLYSLWAYMVRAYGVLHNYRVYNKYYAEGIFRSMGLDFDDFQYRAADFRTFINMFAHKLSKVCCPTSLTYITRHVWMYSHIWVDSPSKKAQSYLYDPKLFWQYDEKGSARGGQLVPREIGSHTCFDDLRNLANEMLAAVIESEDLMIMSGDILKAFGSDKIMALATIPEDFSIIAEYDEAVCSQIQNAFAVGRVNPFNITQNPDTGAILCEPTIEGTEMWPDTLHLNLRMDAPTPADTMVATRLMATCHNGADGVSVIDTCGSEIVTDINILYYHVNSSNGTTNPKIKAYATTAVKSFLDDDTCDDTAHKVLMLSMMEKFDWHPTQYLLDFNGDLIDVSGDVDNYTSVTPNNLKDMHELALVSQFGCPSMGPFNIK